ncbi:MAG: glycosyltransferase family 4 protein, partial [Anaerolineae bacterium]|nr:glycosyltransferase family 4 protein [Anaerolineae bacterium]
MSSDKIRLLLFNLKTDADDSNLGFTTDWINGLAPFCEYIDVVTMQAGRLAVADNVRVYSVGKERGYGDVRRALEFYRILLLLLRERCYDVCFAHMMPLFAVMGAPPLKLWRVPVVLWYTHKAVSFKLRLAEKVSWRIVTASPESFRLPSQKVHIVGHGVDTNLFKPDSRVGESEQPFVVISVGRIAPVKSLETLLEAAQSLAHDSHYHDLRVRIIGEAAPEHAEYGVHLRERVKALNLDTIVEFAGGISHERVAQAYQAADVMVNSSQTGSIDKAVLEAMACGLPVVTSNEAFRAMLGRWDGFLYIPPDAPDKLAVSLLRLKGMPIEERMMLGND